MLFEDERINIEHMSDEFLHLAQLAAGAWPLLVALSAGAVLFGKGRWKSRFKRSQRAALAAWLVMLPAWIFAWFGPRPKIGILPEPHNSIFFLVGLALLLFLEAAPWLKHLQPDLWMSPAQRIRQIHAIEQLNALHPTQFEKLVQATYRQLGYSARHIGQAGDHGVDLEVRTPRGERWVVQCKRWRDPVGEAKVRELYGTLLHEGAHRAVLVTSAEITPPARAWARGKPIDLIDGPALLRMIQRAQRVKRPGLLLPIKNALARMRLTRPKPPICPRCQLPMVPHPSRPARQNRFAYRCSRYPDCRVVVIK